MVKKLIDELLDFAESSIFAIMAVMWMFTFIFRIAVVDGISMQPTLNHEERLVVTHLFYEPEPGDIIIVRAYAAHVPDKGSGEIIENGKGLEKILVKRVVAVGGQWIDIDFESNIVRVGETKDTLEAVKEEYIQGRTVRESNIYNFPMKIPEGYVFVMGDNRSNSEDSRSERVGLIDENDILGKAVFRIYPWKKVGGLY